MLLVHDNHEVGTTWLVRKGFGIHRAMGIDGGVWRVRSAEDFVQIRFAKTEDVCYGVW